MSSSSSEKVPLIDLGWSDDKPSYDEDDYNRGYEDGLRDGRMTHITDCSGRGCMWCGELLRKAEKDAE